MKKKILIPTDFSKNAWNALTYASDLFEHVECVFYVLNAYDAKPYSIGDLMVPEPGSPSYESAKDQAVNGLAKIMDMLDFRETNHKHTYEFIAELNDPLTAMKNFIEQRDIELVVMGTKGASNSRGSLFGSNTIMAMEKLRACPVMGVPIDARVAYVKEIVIPTSYKTYYKRRELTHLVEISRLHDATISVIHVNTTEVLTEKQEKSKTLLEECLEGATYSFHHVHGTDVTAGVRDFTKSHDSDMLAIINRKHAFFGSVFTTPLVKELGMFTRVPLLVMHDIQV
ncbi:universal stress protein [Dokdonia sp. Asnod2-E02]|uniref:universal stress protein n=1 Tax=Dokdonia sp. Asnod2-E02 TaxID=3160574 RepID=UPI00386AEC20